MEPAPLAPALPAWLADAATGLQAYADLLAAAGVTRGMIGPREVPRLWERHLLNCAVVAEPDAGLIRAGAKVADVGSGAGLPGLVWALARPDIEVLLIEPLLRRATFLEEAIAQLGLGARVSVSRTRAEACTDDPTWRPRDVVTARAVAALPVLLAWMVPLVSPSGTLLALKGQRAGDELHAVAQDPTLVEIRRAWEFGIIEVGVGVVDPPTTVVRGLPRTAQ